MFRPRLTLVVGAMLILPTFMASNLQADDETPPCAVCENLSTGGGGVPRTGELLRDT